MKQDSALNTLAVLVRNYLAIPATSAPSEWVFSLHGGKHLQQSPRFPGDGAVECVGLSKCKQQFAEQLTSSPRCQIAAVQKSYRCRVKLTLTNFW